MIVYIIKIVKQRREPAAAPSGCNRTPARTEAEQLDGVGADPEASICSSQAKAGTPCSHRPLTQQARRATMDARRTGFDALRRLGYNPCGPVAQR
jgi:hypothetical protein